MKPSSNDQISLSRYTCSFINRFWKLILRFTVGELHTRHWRFSVFLLEARSSDNVSSRKHEKTCVCPRLFFCGALLCKCLQLASEWRAQSVCLQFVLSRCVLDGEASGLSPQARKCVLLRPVTRLRKLNSELIKVGQLVHLDSSGTNTESTRTIKSDTLGAAL